MSKELKNEVILDEDEQNEAVTVYELGFHFVPTIAETDVPVQFSHLKSIIEKQGGEFISEDFPKLLDLAYEISKTVKAVKKHYSKSYFGWVKFSLATDKIAVVEKEVKASDVVLRYLLVKTVRENTIASQNLHKDGTRTRGPEKEGELSTDETPAVVIDEAQIDKSIEELVA